MILVAATAAFLLAAAASGSTPSTTSSLAFAAVAVGRSGRNGARPPPSFCSSSSACRAASPSRAAADEAEVDVGGGAASPAAEEGGGGGNFWSDSERVASLPDPPPPDLLELIRRRPYRGGFEPASDVEEPYEPEIVEGCIPKDLVGSLATNGPGRIRIGTTQYGHWFDGDGYVTLLSLDGRSNRARFVGRYVRSGRFRAQERLLDSVRDDEELRNNPPLAFSGAWTLGGRGRWYENVLRFPTNPANTATMWLLPRVDDERKEPRLYALCEGGHPIELDPITLDTIGDQAPFFASTSSGSAERVRSFFSAHYSRCPVTGDVYNHGYVIRPGPLGKQLNVMRLSSDGALLQQATSPLPFDTFVHDAALSANCIAYFVPPYSIPDEAMPSVLAGKSALASNMRWDESQPCALHVHSRYDLGLKWRIELPEAMSMYHLVDAYDEPSSSESSNGDGDGDGIITLKVRVMEHVLPREEEDNGGADTVTDVGAVRAEAEDQFTDQYRVEDGRRIYNRLREYVFELCPDGTGRVAAGSPTDVVAGEDAAPCEFPAVNDKYLPGRRRRYCWTSAASGGRNAPPAGWLDGVQKVDMEAGTASEVASFGDGNYAGAPAFVPREGGAEEGVLAEDDGYILATVYRSREHRSDVVVLDAATLETLCVVALRGHVPHQFHGDFVQGFVPWNY